jgi:hypothetical protein
MPARWAEPPDPVLGLGRPFDAVLNHEELSLGGRRR